MAWRIFSFVSTDRVNISFILLETLPLVSLVSKIFARLYRLESKIEVYLRMIFMRAALCSLSNAVLVTLLGSIARDTHLNNYSIGIRLLTMLSFVDSCR